MKNVTNKDWLRMMNERVLKSKQSKNKNRRAWANSVCAEVLKEETK